MTITSRECLQQELAEVRFRGYAIDEGEFSEGLCCLAVPVEGLGDRFVLGISVPTARFRPNLERYLSVVLRRGFLSPNKDHKTSTYDV